jgi:hypothetical protein
MGRKESDATKEVDTFYPGLWRTKTTRVDESQLRKKYSISTSVKLHFGTENKGAMVRKDEQEICVYEDMFEAGFRFPFPKVVRELLHYLQIALHQLAPNAWRTFFACVILWPRILGEGHELSIREFLKIYRPLRNPKTEYVFNFQGRQKIKFVLLPGYSSNKYWKERFFFAQSDWECSAIETVADPKVPREVRRLLSSKQDEPVLTKSENAHVQDLLKYSEEHAVEMDFDAIFSQAALAIRLKYPPTLNIAGSDALAKSKPRRKRKAAALQISESQPVEIAQPEVPTLSSGKSSSGVNVGENPEFSQEETSERTIRPGTPASSKKQRSVPAAQHEEITKSFKFDSVRPSLTDQLSVETQQEVFQPSRPDIAQSSLAEQSLVTVTAFPTPSEGRTQPAEGISTVIGEPLEHSVIMPSPANYPRKTREEKGKSIVRDDTPDIFEMEGSEINLLSDPTVNKAEDESSGNFPREGTESEQPGLIAEAHSDEMPEVTWAKFLSLMLKTKVFTQKGQTTTANPSNAKLHEETTTAEEQENRVITVEEQGNVPMISSSDAPSFHISADAGSLSDSNKETEQYLERMLMNVTTESPFAQVSSIAEATESILGFDLSGAKEAGVSITKEASASTPGKGEIRTISIADYESRLRREGSFASQIAMDASPIGGSMSGQTPDAIYWFVSETLNQLGEKWLGNPLTTLAGLIPAPAMAEVKAMTSQETTDYMIFHLINVSVLCFDQIVYITFLKLILRPHFTGFHAWHGLLL